MAMKGLRRSPEFYLSWMIGGDASERRKEIANELDSALKTGHYDQETLETINFLLAHELLCVENYQELCRQSEETGIFIEKSPRPALSTRWLEEFILTYSCSLTRSICPSTYYERELQAHGIGLALSVLRSNQASAFEDSYKSELGALLKDRFQTLQWLHHGNLELSGAVFHQFQCSYQLVFAGEYSKRFRLLEPTAVAFVRKFFSTVSLASSLASFSLGGGLPDFLGTITALHQIFTWPNPSVKSQYESLFAIQELTELTTALNRLSEVSKDASRRPSIIERVSERSKQLACGILRTIYEIIETDTFRQFELSGLRRRSFTDYFNAFASQGPSTFDRYYFLYGLLDCAARLTRLLSPELLPAEFKARMVKIATRSVEPSYRWKAIEILLSVPASREQQYNTCLGVQDPPETLRNELKVILYDCLNAEEKVVLPERTPVAIMSELDLEEWSEIPRPSHSLPFNRKCIKNKIAKVSFTKRNFISTGLSPDCRNVFFLRSYAVELLSLDEQGNVEQRRPVKLETRPDCEISAAALSNNFLVLSTKQKLMVYDHEKKRLVGSATFATETFENQWTANCLAIHETPQRAWIVVAGSQGMSRNGSLRAYQIVIMSQSTELKKYDASFDTGVFDKEYIKHLSFCSRGTRLVCVTHTHKVLAFFLSNNARPRESPFKIVKRYSTLETNAIGVTSATLFYSWTDHPYVLVTTAPSSERGNYDNEWTYISAVGDGPNLRVPDSLQDNLQQLGKHEAILAGAVSPCGDLIALLEKTGRLTVTSLVASRTQRGLRATGENMFLKEKLCQQSPALGVDPTSLRFHYDASGLLWLKAVDVRGSIIALRVEEPCMEPSHVNGCFDFG